jgi:hypothetical protein
MVYCIDFSQPMTEEGVIVEELEQHFLHEGIYIYISPGGENLCSHSILLNSRVFIPGGEKRGEHSP